MKKYIVFFIGIITITIFFQGCITENQTNSKVLYVSLSKDATYNSIQSAINDSVDHGIIYVSDGTYYENIKISKSLSIIGSSFNTIIDGKYIENVIEISAQNVTLSNLTIRHANDSTNNDEIRNGINVLTNNNTITNCRIFEDKIGIHLSSNHFNKIENNSFENCSYGIWAKSSADNIIQNNYFSNNSAYGMYIYTYCDRNTIQKNDFTNNLIALRVKGNFNIITKNDFFANEGGIYLCCSAINNTVYHNNFLNNVEYNGRGNYHNQWYNKTIMQGNYWSDYNGTDLNNDTIGDSAYLISTRNISGTEEIIIDKYPLMNPLTI